MRTDRGLGELVVGIGLVIAGILFLLSTFDIVEGIDWWRWLPALLIVWGALQFFSSRGSNVLGSLVLVLVGFALLLATTGVMPWRTFGQLWPAALILLGLAILIGWRRVDRVTAGAAPGDTVALVSVLGENVRSFTSQSFKGGQTTALMGSAKVDLRDARLAEGAAIDVTVVMGGLELKVPDEWEMDTTATVIMGG
ncbi:MAG: DUF5668 domain-containing protein, partial [Dehalococcoidia bacterium]